MASELELFSQKILHYATKTSKKKKFLVVTSVCFKLYESDNAKKYQNSKYTRVPLKLLSLVEKSDVKGAFGVQVSCDKQGVQFLFGVETMELQASLFSTLVTAAKKEGGCTSMAAISGPGQRMDVPELGILGTSSQGKSQAEVDQELLRLARQMAGGNRLNMKTIAIRPSRERASDGQEDNGPGSAPSSISLPPPAERRANTISVGPNSASRLAPARPMSMAVPSSAAAAALSEGTEPHQAPASSRYLSPAPASPRNSPRTLGPSGLASPRRNTVSTDTAQSSSAAPLSPPSTPGATLSSNPSSPGANLGHAQASPVVHTISSSPPEVGSSGGSPRGGVAVAPVEEAKPSSSIKLTLLEKRNQFLRSISTPFQKQVVTKEGVVAKDADVKSHANPHVLVRDRSPSSANAPSSLASAGVIKRRDSFTQASQPADLNDPPISPRSRAIPSAASYSTSTPGPVKFDADKSDNQEIDDQMMFEFDPTLMRMNSGDRSATTLPMSSTGSIPSGTMTLRRKRGYTSVAKPSAPLPPLPPVPVEEAPPEGVDNYYFLPASESTVALASELPPLQDEMVPLPLPEIQRLPQHYALAPVPVPDVSVSPPHYYNAPCPLPPDPSQDRSPSPVSPALSPSPSPSGTSASSAPMPMPMPRKRSITTSGASTPHSAPPSTSFASPPAAVPRPSPLRATTIASEEAT